MAASLRPPFAAPGRSMGQAAHCRRRGRGGHTWCHSITTYLVTLIAIDQTRVFSDENSTIVSGSGWPNRAREDFLRRLSRVSRRLYDATRSLSRVLRGLHHGSRSRDRVSRRVSRVLRGVHRELRGLSRELRSLHRESGRLSRVSRSASRETDLVHDYARTPHDDGRRVDGHEECLDDRASRASGRLWGDQPERNLL